MSDSIPNPPTSRNLRQQRKRAKELLKASRATNPAMKLADAQLAVAREAGFDSWPKLVAALEQFELQLFHTALQKGDAAQVKSLLASSPSVRRKLNSPIGDFGGRPINIAAKHREVLGVLLDHGADINHRSDWSNGPFGVLDYCDEPTARHLISRGAVLTAHACARFGWIAELKALVDGNPEIVHERGGDGQQPLHLARTPEIAEFLLAKGAQIDTRCIDHHSTPAQYALAERPEVCRYLLSQGATPDIFMAARLPDERLALKLIDQDATCLLARINVPGYAPVPGFNIYCWSLGYFLSPHEVALKHANTEMHQLLLSRSPASVRLLDAIARDDEAAARKMVADDPALIGSLSKEQQSLLAHAAFHNRVKAVRLMLSLGFDPAAKGQAGGSVLHCAAWVGNVEMVEMLLKRNVDLHLKDPTHHGTPLGWARHGAEHSGWPADHAGVIKLLLAAGAS